MKIKTLLFTLAVALAPSLAFAADTTPTVTLQTRSARGATMAFFRISTTANGSQIKERGICYATHSAPTVDDNTCTTTIAFEGGSAYWLKNLTPSTCYYARGYAKDANGNIAYTDARRFFTLPKGQISYTLRDGGDEAIQTRLKNACEKITGLWNDLTSIWGFYPSVGYASGTPTADCSYGGWTRVGPTVSYQAPGTILHEWLHGVGVGTHWIWYSNADMRANTSSGYWLGERATDAVRFIQNSETAQLNGDGTHMWPYGVNGAHEDNGTDALYVSGSLICQALGEDGLPMTSGMGFATPYDAFDYVDGQKYYLRSEDENHGRYSSFLKEQADGSLKWVGMSTEAATANDSTAWTFTYDPATCYYNIKNVATGHAIIYSGGFKCSESTTGASARIQLLRGRVASVEGFSGHGYFLASNQHYWNSPVLSADANGAIKTGSFSFSNDATADRWLILTADESKVIDKIGMEQTAGSLDDLLKKLEALLAVPHTETVSGTDAALQTVIDEIRSAAANVTDVSEIETLETKAYDAVTAFLPGVQATYEDKPFDITLLMSNPEVQTSTDGWEGSPTMNYLCAEFFQSTFNFYQDIVRDFPKGYYRAYVQAFQRPGTTAASYTAWSAGTATTTTEVYIGAANASKIAGQTVKNIWDEAQSTKVGTGTEVTADGATVYVPNNMQAAAAYFDKGLYDNYKQTRQYAAVTAAKGGMRIGIRCTSSSSSYWSIFRNFRFYYYGTSMPATTSGITAPQAVRTSDAKTFNVYGINGQLVRSNATSLDGLARGIYIVNGKKVVK